ncbi:hypothetical protein RKE30_22235 [Streptomyces sp. Li-HN-5-11]|uniref:hypothetical protein n=1 Tax=Streptomyces sp. Li-HN-5-11 TaxID=3075432 RepID=UPI0028A59B96|nr:hypothetical protein [Streptomyces sp. Li-HN-5-11]WNM32908.1 hypothetical protein RKE30_22235 [Streptomyces sp. Li-HN-5-11]
MLALFLGLVIVAIALAVVGVTVSGVTFLLAIGIVVFLADVLFLGVGLGRRRGTRPSR